MPRSLRNADAGTNLGRAALAAALLLSASTAIPQEASTQEAAATESVIDTVEVPAQRERLRKAVATFVANVTRADGQDVARWRDSLCPWVSGASADQGDFIKSRIGEIATSVGVRFDQNPKCTSNLLVLLTTQPNELAAALKARPTSVHQCSAAGDRRYG